MADTFETLADMLVINDQNLADLNITDLLDDAPLLRALAAEVASNGHQHKYTKETGAPVVGFRAVNTGVDLDVSSDTLVTITLKYLDASTRVDVAIADIWKGGPEAFVARKNYRSIKAAFAAAEAQLIYGVGALADGFVGLADASTLDALADQMVINAAGTTENTASSCYLLRTNGDGTDVTLITGNEGQISMGEAAKQEVQDASAQKYHAYCTSIGAYLGLQIGSAYSAGRIVNLTEDSGKGLTDALIYEALAEFPASRQPNLIVMNRRSLRQLRDSRTATNVTGAPAPRPTEVEGIPIITTDAITSTEALVT